MFDYLYVAAKAKMMTFRRDEEGVALTEYILMLGLLIGGVIVAVALFGTNLSAAWSAWANWLSDTSGVSVPQITLPN